MELARSACIVVVAVPILIRVINVWSDFCTKGNVSINALMDLSNMQIKTQALVLNVILNV